MAAPRRILGITLFSALSFAAIAQPAPADDPPSPIALLQGAEKARSEYDTLVVTLELRNVEPAGITRDCLIEMHGRACRFEVLPGERPGTVVVRDGDSVTSFRRSEHADVRLCDLQSAVGEHGDLAFDPRILGLTDLLAAHTKVADCIWARSKDAVQLVGQETLNGVDVWRIKVSASGGDTSSEYWIEHPSCRVHRRTISFGDTTVVVDSEFDSIDESWPFPKRVKATRTSPRGRRETIVDVKTFEEREVSEDRFTLRSFDLPVNTAIIDYEAHKRIGYWDGEGLSPDPVRRDQ